MADKPKREVFGAALRISRLIGLILIAIAILGLPEMRFLTGRFAAIFEVTMSAMLALAGLLWLFGAQVFLRFFDRYLSRN